MIKEIRAWFSKREDGGEQLNITTEIDHVYEGISYRLIDQLQDRIVAEVVNKFLVENGETLKKEILNNPRFADAVYNAMVIKKAQQIL